MPKMRKPGSRYMEPPQRVKRGRHWYYFVPYRNEWLTARQIADLPECKVSLTTLRSRIQRVVVGREHMYKDFKDLITQERDHGGSQPRNYNLALAKSKLPHDPCWFMPVGSLAHTVR